MSNKILIKLKPSIEAKYYTIYNRPHLSEIVESFNNILRMNKTKYYKSKKFKVNQGIVGKIIKKYIITKHKKYFTIIYKTIYIDQTNQSSFYLSKSNINNSNIVAVKKYYIYKPNKNIKHTLSNILSLYKLNNDSIYNYIKIIEN